jgi:D-alanyl-D-alanine dipeptidase
MKPYRTIPINDCGEPLVPIPRENFVFFDPPPYMAFGAPYNGASPWMIRSGVLQALLKAQNKLASLRPGWKIMVFDGYRPNAVQAFMVEREFRLQAEAVNLDPTKLSEADQEMLAAKVFRIWGIPSENPATPPPHSTGGAVDITLADASGKEVDMGSIIDENSDRSNPDHFADAKDEAGQQAHANRAFLHDIMKAEGFQRHEVEWWHFSLGDQYWAWNQRQKDPASEAIARYGRADLVK